MFAFYRGSGCSVSAPAKSSGSARKSFGCVSGGSAARCLIEQTKSKDSPPTGAAGSSIKEGEEAIRALEAGRLFDEEVICVARHANAKERGRRGNRRAASAGVKQHQQRQQKCDGDELRR